MAYLDPVTNFAKSTLSSGIAAGATSLSVAAGEGSKFPQPSTDGAFNAVIWNSTDYSNPSDDTGREIVRVTARSTDALTITRAQEGTSDGNHNTGGKTYSIILAQTAKMMSDISNGLSMREGEMRNGRILPSVDGSGNLTVALKTLAGTDPSAGNPVKVMIGGVVRTITAALSITMNAATNWMNLGSAELATKEADQFAFLGYNATDGVVLGSSRYPGANIYSDFSVTSTNEKYCKISTITNAAASDVYVNIGRFAATLSAGAGYTWSVPTFTASNLIQKPIYTTRALPWNPNLYWFGGSAPTGGNVFLSYRIVNDTCEILAGNYDMTAGTAIATVQINLPFTPVSSASGSIPFYGIISANTIPNLCYADAISASPPYVRIITAVANATQNWAIFGKYNI